MKTRTHSIFPFLLIVFLISSSLLVQAQSPRIKAVHIANKFVNKGDTVQIMLNGARGSIQWQKSMDANTWNNITGATTEILSCKIDTTYYFRARLKEENCDPVFSDTLNFVPYLLKPDVVVLDTTIRLRSDSVSMSKGVLIYDKDISQSFKPGDVIVGWEGEGYMRKVMAVDESADQVVLTTQQAYLEDVIAEIDWHDTISISINGPDPIIGLSNWEEITIPNAYAAPGVSYKSLGKGINLTGNLLGVIGVQGCQSGRWVYQF